MNSSFQIFYFVVILFFIISTITALPTSKRPHRRSSGKLRKASPQIGPKLPLSSLFSNRDGSNFGGGGRGGGNDIFASDAFGEGKRKTKEVSRGLFYQFSNLLRSYSKLLEEHPYTTKMISSGVIGGIGDFLIQKVQGKDTGRAFDFRRWAVFTSVAAFYIAPVINVWFNWLNSLPMLEGMNGFGKALMMTGIDQTIGAVFVNAGFFFAFELFDRIFPKPSPLNLGRPSVIAAGMDAVRNKLWETLVANWYCWPVINFLNFYLVPIQFRVLVSNLAAVFWNMFLSSVANRKVDF
jgi:protein Mpv17